ncbi:MAG: M20/M25/M40 family metallo-hydrolase [Fimbriimonadaceae bacterium]
MKRTLILSLAAVAALSQAQYSGSLPVPAEFSRGFQSIKIEDAKKWLEFLAGPECEGRGSGQPGFQKAADFMAERFKEFGLKPAGDNGTFFQNVPMYSGNILDGSQLTLGDTTVQIGEKMSIGGVGGDTSLKGDLVIVEAKGADAKVPDGISGKIVLALLEGVSRDFRRELANQASAVIEVTDTISSRRNYSAFGTKPKAQIRLSPDIANSFLTKIGFARSTEPGSKATPAQTAEIMVKTEGTMVSVPNVVAFLPGSDHKLAGEYVGIGAHLDHLGVRKQEGQPDVIYYGADDDGSGCTALLNVARAMTSNKVKPKRTILFMAFCGEERGLVGSRWLADNPMFPIEKMTCELQMDMVGRDSDGVQNNDRNRVDVAAENTDTMRLVGSKRISTDLHNTILDLNKHVGFKFKYDSEDVYTRSDHYSFAAKGIPIAFLFDGFHPDYHKPTDTVDKINFEKLTNAARLFYLVGMNAANRPEMFPRDVKPEQGG